MVSYTVQLKTWKIFINNKEIVSGLHAQKNRQI